MRGVHRPPRINPHSAARISSRQVWSPSMSHHDRIDTYVDLDTPVYRPFNTCVAVPSPSDDSPEERTEVAVEGRSGEKEGKGKKRKRKKKKKKRRKGAMTKRPVRARGGARCTVNGVALEGAGNHHHHRRSHQQGPDDSSDRWSLPVGEETAEGSRGACFEVGPHSWINL